jgi:hypothetical protein
VKPVFVLSYWIKRLKILRSKLHSHGDFLNALISCSVKCLRGYKLFFDLISVVDLVQDLASTVQCFRCDS